MKKVFLALAILFSAGAAKAQTGAMGIGTQTPDSSAILDVSASNRGLRIPQISLQNASDSTTIARPATSLLVYNTNAALATNAGSGTGYYYNAGTPAAPGWTRLATGAMNVAKYVGPTGNAYSVALGDIEIRYNTTSTNTPQIKSATGATFNVDVFTTESWATTGYHVATTTGLAVNSTWANLASTSGSNEVNNLWIKMQSGTTMYRVSMLVFPNNTQMILVEKF